MATEAQILANQANAQKAHGPVTDAGKEASSQNSTRHGFNSDRFFLMEDESVDDFDRLLKDLVHEHQPQNRTERNIVRNMAQHDWLRARAMRFQHNVLRTPGHFENYPNLFALLLRYETMHSRSFYKCLRELHTLRKEKAIEEIGFVPKKSKSESGELKMAA